MPKYSGLNKLDYVYMNVFMFQHLVQNLLLLRTQIYTLLSKKLHYKCVNRM